MPTNLKTAITARNAELGALAPLCNTGYIRIYDGTQAATPETALGAQVLLAELRFGATAFGAASGGSINANAISSVSAVATGTATWFRILQSNGTTVVFDGSVGTATSDMILNSVAIQINATVSVTAFSYTLPQ